MKSFKMTIKPSLHQLNPWANRRHPRPLRPKTPPTSYASRESAANCRPRRGRAWGRWLHGGEFVLPSCNDCYIAMEISIQIVNFRIIDGDFPQLCKKLPEGTAWWRMVRIVIIFHGDQWLMNSGYPWPVKAHVNLGVITDGQWLITCGEIDDMWQNLI